MRNRGQSGKVSTSVGGSLIVLRGKGFFHFSTFALAPIINPLFYISNIILIVISSPIH